LSLQTAISGRSQWNDVEKVCTSVNLSKACKKYEELGGYSWALGLGVGSNGREWWSERTAWLP